MIVQVLRSKSTRYSDELNNYKPKKIAVLSEYLNAEGVDEDIKKNNASSRSRHFANKE